MLLLLNWAVLGCTAETEGIPQACEAPPDDAVYASEPNCYFPSNTPCATCHLPAPPLQPATAINTVHRDKDGGPVGVLEAG